MKKSVKYTLLMVFVCVWCVCAGCGSVKVKYPAGRDTRESYGDGTFQLLSLRKTGPLYLSNEAYNSIVLCDVQGVRESDGMLYAIGSAGQCKVYFSADLSTCRMYLCAVPQDGEEFYINRLDEMEKNGDAVCYSSLAEFPEAAREAFEEIK